MYGDVLPVLHKPRHNAQST